ncbi:hypothetical protein C2E23DRAFT_139421 [Lenzites betulinus]|nr:hypothetical protein C2E23DRAFT_139421 [Lenzites betulinus]
MPTNLPPPTYTGPVQGNASIVIDAPVDKVWSALIDFPSYPQWNPFVRSQVVTDKDKNPLADQTPVENAFLVMKVHIPPSLDDSIPTISVFEQITHVQPDLGRVAWNSTLPSWFVKAERWQAVSATEDGKTLYESREIFAGSGAYAIKLFISGDLEKSFVAQAEGLKSYVESLN